MSEQNNPNGSDEGIETAKPRIDLNNIDWAAMKEEAEEAEPKQPEKPHFDTAKDFGVRYARHTGKYWMLSSGLWIEAGPQEIKRHLQIEENCSAMPNEKGRPSEVDEAMHAAIKYYSADKVGGYAGYLKQGVTVLPNGETLLVPVERKVLTPAEGDCDFILNFILGLLPHEPQAEAPLSWLKMAVTSLYVAQPGSWTPGQVLTLLGHSGIGKTSLQEQIITPLLGYRQEKCDQYLTGQSEFNKELGFAEHWLISDASWVRQIEKRIFLARFKDAVANNSMRIRGMREDALNLPTFRRISITLNLDAESIAVLPDMRASHWEKMLVLDCEQPAEAYARKVGDDTWDAKVEAQLPALLHQLLYLYEIPEYLQDKQGRYGVRYSNPKWEKEICAPDQEELDIQAEEIIYEAMFNVDVTAHSKLLKKEVEVTAREVYDAVFLSKSNVKASAELIPVLKKGPRAIGRLLARWSKEPNNTRVYFTIRPGNGAHDKIQRWLLIKIVPEISKMG